jgi:hypothetical protein
MKFLRQILLHQTASLLIGITVLTGSWTAWAQTPLTPMVTFTVDLAQPEPVSRPDLFGIFFEAINYAAEVIRLTSC